MSEDINRFVEVLEITFSACDENGTGFVEINKLIDSLLSHEPSWLNNEIVKEEFQKILHGDLNYVISKEEFIKSLQELYEAPLCENDEDKKEQNINNEAGQCSSSTSGIGEPSEITSGSSTNSLEKIYSGTNFVSDEQIFTNEDSVDEMSLNDSGTSQGDLRLVKLLQSENSTLQRKIEYLEDRNNSLLGQVSGLEDRLVKNQSETLKESEDLKNQLDNTNERLEMQIQMHEETEDKISVLTEERKLLKTQLYQSQRENKKLNKKVFHLEDKLENSLRENMEKNTKLEEVTNKLNKLNGLYSNSVGLQERQQELFRCKELESENALKEAIEENRYLQSQLDSNYSYTKDIELKLKTIQKELSVIRSSSITNKFKTDNPSNLHITDDSMVIFDENFPLGSTIPFESSLLAELKDEVKSDEGECCCVCSQNVALRLIPSETADASIETCPVETAEKSTMTTVPSVERPPTATGDRKSSTFHLLKSKRSVQKWCCLFGVVLFLSALLVFFSLRIVLPPNFKRSHKSSYYFTSVFNLLQVHVKPLDIPLPIK